MLNLQGTFYEIPRSNSGDRYRMRPLATHGKRITDFASWRGLLVLTGVLDDARASASLVRTPSAAALAHANPDDDAWINLFEFLFGTDPFTPSVWPLDLNADGMGIVLRNLTSTEEIQVAFESTTDLLSDWHPRPDLVTPHPDQSGVPAGFTRWRFTFDLDAEPVRFVRLSISL